MSKKICHAHCPDDSGALLAVLGLALAVVLAVIIGQVVESLFVAIVAASSVLGAAGIGLFAYLIRRDRWSAAESRELAAPRVVVRVIPKRTAQAISAPRGAIEAPRPGLADIEALAAERGYDVIRQARRTDP